MRIAIIGSSGNIATGITPILNRDNQLCLFSRSGNNLDSFLTGRYDAIINCAGSGTDNPFIATEFYDTLIFNNLNHNPDTVVISLSSGVAGRMVLTSFGIKDQYAIAKLNSEAKHRASPYRIIDLRLFSYFGHTCRITDSYLVNAIVKCMLYDEPFVSDMRNFTRDYIAPADLASLIIKAIKYGKNDVFEAYSLESTSKMDILERFHAELGLSYQLRDMYMPDPATGWKLEYTPNNKRAYEIGYQPTLTSLDNLIDEARIVLK